ncbi:MAG TPA: deoxyhypusine synthase [Syntrophales bacterium]|nr:deoxyhypusine synthase [Syntrophales bacterium]HOM07319.1 deoxyhypusine synthase [Syntrophales bacterium]HPC01300.1 deoxyhypusine synthase [Syntrophales bacterium]HPQ06836.1 deoxyhypusine synthase [Syntrophales bacterium]HRS87067.1 deoxyhypusine synthase [Syntrophales bacterium]
MEKRDFLKSPVRHIDIKTIDAVPIVEAMKGMSFSARDLAEGAEIYDRMLRDRSCVVILTLAGSTSAAGCMDIYTDMVRHNMVDVVVATGASIVDMDFFEALGFRHYQGTPQTDDRLLRSLYIDRIYDTYIDEEQLQVCDRTVCEIADALPPRPYSSREFIAEMGRWLTNHAKKQNSLIQVAYEKDVPIFCPAFSDCSAGFGLVLHQYKNPKDHCSIDSVKDFRELTMIKMAVDTTGLFMIGGGVPKNFAQDTVICAEILGREVPMHKYAVQITVADVRDGGCSGSTLKEATSWGKVDGSYEKMIYAEATMALPLIAAYVYQKGAWRRRKKWRLARLFKEKG